MTPPRPSMSPPLIQPKLAEALTTALNAGDAKAWGSTFAALRKFTRTDFGMASLEGFLEERLEDALDYGHDWAISDLVGCVNADGIAAGFLHMVRRGNLARMAQLLPLVNPSTVSDPAYTAILFNQTEALAFLWETSGLVQPTPQKNAAWLTQATQSKHPGTLAFLLDHVTVEPDLGASLMIDAAHGQDPAVMAILVARVDVNRSVPALLARHFVEPEIVDAFAPYLDPASQALCLASRGAEALPNIHARVVAAERLTHLGQRPASGSRARLRS